MTAPVEPAATESIALRAFALLEQVVNVPNPMSLDEVTSALGLPKPTVYRILKLLKDASLLRREDGTKRYTIGPRLAAFAVALWRSDRLRTPWRRALEQAVAETGESCNLTLLESNQVLYLDRVETSHPLRLHLEVGTRVPLHCTASGKLFLSELEEPELHRLLGPQPYQRFTAKTLTTLAALKADLARVRKSGVGTHDCELFEDSVAIAVPVRTPGGAIFAAVALHAPSSRASIRSCLALVPVLQRAAATIAASLTPWGAPMASEQPAQAGAGPRRQPRGGSKATGTRPAR